MANRNSLMLKQLENVRFMTSEGREQFVTNVHYVDCTTLGINPSLQIDESV
jgi:hypothetical protein